MASAETESDFNKIKAFPGRNTLKEMRLWSGRLDWLYSIIQPADFIQGIAHTKVRQFASQAGQLELGDMKNISSPAKRYTFLLCFLHEAQTSTRDKLTTMFLKRMRLTHNRSKELLEKLKEAFRTWEEQMMEAFNEVVACAADEPRDPVLGKQIRTIIDEHGGVDELAQKYQIVSAYHGNNHLPLLWGKHKAHRSTIYKLLDLLGIESASEDTGLLTAFKFIKTHRKARRDYLPYDVKLDFLCALGYTSTQSRT